jgi:lipopolysaccharide/colanic/teichoic acid biosynthesis glycosyltransferase
LVPTAGILSSENHLKAMVKRFFDFFFAALLLLLFSWVLLVSWLIAALDTRTNGIFLQQRIGQHGKKITVYKLRTIRPASRRKGVRISKMGRMLRRYKLNELPQLFQVLTGTLSMVGPRPDVPGYYDLLEGENRKLLALKPGLSSRAALKYFDEEALLAQQQDPLWYNDTVLFPDKVQMNLEYYYHHSFWGDISIILDTVRFVFLKRSFD